MAQKTPFVAIIGGLRGLDAGPTAQLKALAKELGAALAVRGFGLVVYFSDDLSLEPHVVSGFVRAVPVGGSGPKRIRVRYAESQRSEVKFAEQSARDDLFDVEVVAGKEWEAAFYRSLVARDGVDAVLLVAGARSTLIAGQIAVARDLPVLAIDTFEGAAGTIRTELATRTDSYPSATTANAAKLVEWLSSKCSVVALKAAEDERMRLAYARARSTAHATQIALGAFLALATAIVFGAVRTPAPSLYPLVIFGGLISAGATGATSRAVFMPSETAIPTTSLLLGSIAGFVVGIAYLIPQWVGAPGVLDAKATIVMATDKIQFFSAVLIAISAGVGFDTVFTRMKRQAEDQPIGVKA